jgi:hypothetical protein
LLERLFCSIMVTLFNYYELKNKGKTYEGILILAYCLTQPYMSRLSIDADGIRRKLHIDIVPPHLFRLGYLKVHKNGIFNCFRIKEPQSYFNNGSFLSIKIPIHKKIEYLYILGQRRINDDNIFFPRYYLTEKQQQNPLILNVGEQTQLIMEKNNG